MEHRRYWLVHPNGCRQRIDPARFDLEALAARAQASGARLVAETDMEVPPTTTLKRPPSFDPPVAAIGPLFRSRFARIHVCRVPFDLDINVRRTVRVLGGYYRRTRLIRVYAHDRKTGRRPLEELFDTFLHEVAHHLEYTEPDSFDAALCGRVRGRMHSALFWRILGHLKFRWAEVQQSESTTERVVAAQSSSMP